MSDYMVAKCLLIQARALLHEASVLVDDFSQEGEDIAFNLSALVSEVDYWIREVEKRGASHEKS